MLTGQTVDEQIERAFHAGQQDLQKQEFARAVDEFESVLALDPILVEAEVNLGLAYQGLLNYDLASQFLVKALRTRPNLLGPTIIVGMDYLKLDEPGKAIPFLKRALQLDEANRDAHEALAAAYLAQENFRNAAVEFDRIASLDPDKSEAGFKVGHEYLDLAARLAFRAARLYPESAWGHRFLGDLLLQRGLPSYAVVEYRKALGIEPHQPGLHASIGQANLHSGNPQEAEREFHLQLQLDPKSEPAWLGLAEIHLANGQGPSALDCVQTVWDISPEFLAAQRDFPSAEIRRETTMAVISSLQSAPEGAGKNFLLAALFAAINDSASANREAKSFEDDFSSSRKQSVTEGDSCQTHRYRRCIDWLSRRQNLNDAQRLLLGKAYLVLRQYELGAEALTRVGGVTPANAEASYWLSRIYQAQGANAYSLLQEAFPDSWRAHEWRAEFDALRLDLNEAVKEFHAALAIRPNEPQLHAALGEFYLQHRNEDEAANELERAFMLDPSRTQTLSLLGRLYLGKRDNEKAATYLQRALLLQPDLTEASSLLGTAYVRLGKFAEAVPKLGKAAPFDYYGNVHYELYLAYRKLGQTELAQKALQRSRDLQRSSLQQDQARIMGSPEPEPR